MLSLVIGQARYFKYAIRHLFKQKLPFLVVCKGYKWPMVAHYRIVVDYEVITRIGS